MNCSNKVFKLKEQTVIRSVTKCLLTEVPKLLDEGKEHNSKRDEIKMGMEEAIKGNSKTDKPKIEIDRNRVYFVK